MTSEFKTNKISPATGTTLTVGDSGDTVDLSTATVTLPAASVTDHVVPYDDNTLKEEIALLGFRTAANGSLAKYNLVDQTIDAFQDASGINAGASTNEGRNSAGKYYSGAGAGDTTGSNPDTTTIDGDYTVFQYTTTGSRSFVIGASTLVEYLMVAGGGGGGTTSAGQAGGGGAGGVLTNYGGTTITLSAATYPIVVGAGGAVGASGVNSTFNSLTSIGGGYGGAYPNTPAASGGSGGGGHQSGVSAANVGGAGTTGQGYKGGDQPYASGWHAGGGGGYGSVGADAGFQANPAHGGNGGTALTSTISGTSTTYAGGGAGSTHIQCNTMGLGGGTSVTANKGGGGDGGLGSTAATAGVTGTGGGGGGGTDTRISAAGGSGIVILRFVAYHDMTLVSETTTAQTAPTKGDIVFTYSNGAGTTTLGTDVTAEYSADGGSTWTAMTLGSEGTTGSHNIATAHDVALTSTSGTSMAYRIKTLNQSATKTTRIQAVSLGWS